MTAQWWFTGGPTPKHVGPAFNHHLQCCTTFVVNIVSATINNKTLPRTYIRDDHGWPGDTVQLGLVTASVIHFIIIIPKFTVDHGYIIVIILNACSTVRMRLSQQFLVDWGQRVPWLWACATRNELMAGTGVHQHISEDIPSKHKTFV